MGDSRFNEEGFWKDWRGIQEKRDWDDFKDPHEVGDVDGKIAGDLELPEYKLLLGQRGMMFKSNISAQERKRMIQEGIEHDKKMHIEGAEAI